MTIGRSSLFADLDVDVSLDAPIGSMTWYGVGGRADVLLRPRTVDALATLVKRCHRSGEPLRVVGRGANLLVADEGVGGVVVRLDAPAFRRVEFEAAPDGTLLRAMAGADLAKTLNDATRRGLAGLQHLAGIPSTVGGAVRMNAGGRYGNTADTLREVTVVTREGDVVTRPRESIEFGYRTTSLDDPIILEAVFRLTPEDPVALRAKVMEIFNYKKSTQPLAEHSAGCAFKNPWDPSTERRVSAGQLIDRAGLKGTRVGGAYVSERHANFIAAEAGAKADHVIELLEIVRRRVFEETGLSLENEVVVWRREGL